MDLTMPNVDGIQAIKKIRAIDPDAKPFQIERVISAVDKALN